MFPYWRRTGPCYRRSTLRCGGNRHLHRTESRRFDDNIAFSDQWIRVPPTLIFCTETAGFQLLRRNAFPITSMSDIPMAAAERMGVKKPNMARGMPAAL